MATFSSTVRNFRFFPLMFLTTPDSYRLRSAKASGVTFRLEHYRDYLIAPDRMGKHRVKHNLVIRDGKGTRLTASAVARIVSDARRRRSTFGEVYKLAHGRLPSWLGYEQDKEPLWMFAPSLDLATEAKPRWPLAQDPTFDSPNLFLFEVDDEMQVVELSALTSADWEDVTDPGFVSFFV